MESKARWSIGHMFKFELFSRMRFECDLNFRMYDLKAASAPEKSRFSPPQKLSAKKMPLGNYFLDMSGSNLVINCRQLFRVEIRNQLRQVQVDGQKVYVETNYTDNHCGFMADSITKLPENQAPLQVEYEFSYDEDELGNLEVFIGRGTDQFSLLINAKERFVIVHDAAIKALYCGEYILEGPGLPRSVLFSGLKANRPTNAISTLHRLKRT